MQGDKPMTTAANMIASKATADDPSASLLDAPEQVLTTLNRDGSRRWMKPRLSGGRFLTARRIVAYLLIGLFTAAPLVHINGKPMIFLNLAQRQFTILGFTFLPTDSVLLALFLLSALSLILLFTALAGRVWCGWACPQTVYMEFLYRPIERLFEGTTGKGGPARGKLGSLRKAAMYVTFLAASLLLAHTFLAYFVGVDALTHWIRQSPLEHPAPFLVVVITTLLMMFNFAYFREQVCLVACPYGRLQSVLLDRDSLIIRYDEKRGEPRGKFRSQKEEFRSEDARRTGTPLPILGGERQIASSTSEFRIPTSDFAARGHCIDCNLCVVTCPTGIDIRNGLQMECVGCAQCIDACDHVMDKIGRPRGLIRYSSRERMAGGRGRILRGRIFFYAAIFLAASSTLAGAIAMKQAADVTLLRGPGMPFTVMGDGNVSNQIRIRITNRSDTAACYTVSLSGADDATFAPTENPVCLQPGESRTDNAVIIVPAESYDDGKRSIMVRVTDGASFTTERRHLLLGPEHHGEED